MFLNQCDEWEQQVEYFWNLMDSEQLEVYITFSSLEQIFDNIKKNYSLVEANQVRKEIEELFQIIFFNIHLYEKAKQLPISEPRLALEITCANDKNLLFINYQNFSYVCSMLCTINTIKKFLNTLKARQRLEYLYCLQSSSLSTLPNDPDETLDQSLHHENKKEKLSQDCFSETDIYGDLNL